jgi:addiction module HigA family antidote
MSKDKHPPVHPGEILNEEFILPMGIMQYRLAKDLSVPPPRINEIVRGKRGISAVTAIRLSVYFGTSPNFWMSLQSRYELEVERDRHEVEIKREIKPVAAFSAR